jgi:flagellar hook-associated protein 1
MGTINSAFNITKQALEADQEALNVISNNVANASTEGYTRQSVVWQQNSTVTVGNLTFGEGASISSVQSQRDLVLQQRLDQQQQLQASSSTRYSALQSVQALFSITSSSSTSSGDIGTDLTSFFDSFSSLESNPSDQSSREEVLSTATSLASDISSTAKSLSSQQTGIDQNVSSVVSQINSLSSAIAKLNGQIQQNSSESDAGELEDQRQQDISDLSKLVGISQVSTGNNGLQITTTSGRLLVNGEDSYDLTTGASGGVLHVFSTLGSTTTDITSELTSGGGSMSGYLTARDTDIPKVISQLDNLAYYVSTSVNTLNNAGTDLAGDSTNAGNIFSAPTAVSGSAATMSVVMTDTNHIAAASSGSGTGNNANAVLMAKLASQTIVNGQTPSNYYSSLVSSLGTTISEVETEMTSQSSSVSQLQSQVDSLSSVNLNDEASSLALIERSYQAASKVFSILNTVMASALNLGSQTTVS